jgi:hypothetical protein
MQKASDNRKGLRFWDSTGDNMRKSIWHRRLKRSIRRHHQQRMIQRAQQSLYVQNNGIETRSLFARKIANHLKVCSCEYSCGNIRTNPWSSGTIRLTLQERKHRLAYREQILEVA